MFGILRLLRQDDRWHELDKALTTAFEKVKGETRNLYSWVRHLREKDLKNDARHEQISRELGENSSIIKTLQMDVAMLKEELRNLHKNSQKISPFPDLVRTKSGLKSEPERKTVLERKILAISRPVKKDYVMQQIESLAQKGVYTTKQIETIIVKEKMLCGRTAFYDYLKEMRLKGRMNFSGKMLEKQML